MAIECKHGRLARKCELCELEEALSRISALEAERDKAVELLKRWNQTGWNETFGIEDESLESDTQEFLALASIGGEGK